MISRNLVKRLLAPVLVLLTVAVAVGAVAAGTASLRRAGTGADTSSALHVVPELPPMADRLISWEPDPVLQGRAVEPQTRIDLQASYVRAWAALGAYQAGGVTAALTQTLTGPALADVRTMSGDGSVGTWSLSHRLRVDFYSLDGTTVGLTDLEAHVVRAVGRGADETIVESRERVAVVMVLEDGYWRVRHWRREAATPVTVTALGRDGRTTTTGTVRVTPRESPRGIATTWSPADWSATSPAAARADAARARAAGVTLLRVPVPYAWLGGGDPDRARVQRFVDTVDALGSAGLEVRPVLTDGLLDLSPGSWAATDVQLGTLVTSLSRSAAVTSWDLGQAPDARAGPATPVEVRAFVLHEAALLRTLDPNRAVTVCWSGPAVAADPVLAGVVDQVCLEWRDDAAGLAAAVGQVRAATGRSPAVVAVTTPTGPSWSPNPHSEGRQAREVEAVTAAARDAGVPLLAVNRWRDTPDDRTGLVRADGSPRPAAGVLAGSTGRGGVPGPGVADYLRSRFWIAVVAAVIVVVLATVRRRRHARPTVVTAAVARPARPPGPRGP